MLSSVLLVSVYAEEDAYCKSYIDYCNQIDEGGEFEDFMVDKCKGACTRAEQRAQCKCGVLIFISFSINLKSFKGKRKLRNGNFDQFLHLLLYNDIYHLILCYLIPPVM